MHQLSFESMIHIFSENSLSANQSQTPDNENFLNVAEIIQNTFISPAHQEQFNKNHSLIKTKYQNSLSPILTIEELIKCHFVPDKRYHFEFLNYKYICL